MKYLYKFVAVFQLACLLVSIARCSIAMDRTVSSDVWFPQREFRLQLAVEAMIVNCSRNSSRSIGAYDDVPYVISEKNIRPMIAEVIEHIKLCFYMTGAHIIVGGVNKLLFDLNKFNILHYKNFYLRKDILTVVEVLLTMVSLNAAADTQNAASPIDDYFRQCDENDADRLLPAVAPLFAIYMSAVAGLLTWVLSAAILIRNAACTAEADFASELLPHSGSRNDDASSDHEPVQYVIDDETGRPKLIKAPGAEEAEEAEMMAMATGPVGPSRRGVAKMAKRGGRPPRMPLKDRNVNAQATPSGGDKGKRKKRQKPTEDGQPHKPKLKKRVTVNDTNGDAAVPKNKKGNRRKNPSASGQDGLVNDGGATMPAPHPGEAQAYPPGWGFREQPGTADPQQKKKKKGGKKKQQQQQQPLEQNADNNNDGAAEGRREEVALAAPPREHVAVTVDQNGDENRPQRGGGGGIAAARPQDVAQYDQENQRRNNRGGAAPPPPPPPEAN